MTITFACPCGKLLKSRAENAGRRTKCPRCGSYLVIPYLSVSHDEANSSGSEPELLSHSDFSDVDFVVRVATAQAETRTQAEASPVSLLQLDTEPSRPENETPAESEPRPETPLPIVLDDDDLEFAPDTATTTASVTAAATLPAAAPIPPPSRAPDPPEPWFFAVLEWNAYLCMGLGVLQFTVVLFAIALGSNLDTARTFVLALVVLIVTLGLGGLALVGLDIARTLRRYCRSILSHDAR